MTADMLAILYLLAIVALASGTSAIYMARVKPFPVQWLYYHYFIRKPLVWTILAGALAWVAVAGMRSGSFPASALGPITIMCLAMALHT